jgi:flagellar basal body-associated protein FliL
LLDNNQSAPASEKSEGKAIIVFWVILLVLLCVPVALAGLLLVRRLVPLPVRESANAVTGIIYGATYVLYGITLAFSLYLGNQEANEARETVEREAGSLEGLFEIAQQLPQPQRDRIQELTESYARIVVDEEWPLMERGQESPQAEALLDELQRTVVEYAPDTSAEQALYSQGITLASDMEEEREIRMLHSSQDSHRLLWHVLVSGGVITVLLSLFFGSKVVWLQGLSVAALTTVVVLLLSATYQLQAPFAGSVRIEPEAFEEVLDDVQRQQNAGAEVQ